MNWVGAAHIAVEMNSAGHPGEPVGVIWRGV